MIVKAISTWLCNQNQFNALPVGTEYAVICEPQSMDEPFTDKYVLVMRPTTATIKIGLQPCPEKYPNGVSVFDDAVLLNWQTVQEPADPLPGATDEQVLMSAAKRKLI